MYRNSRAVFLLSMGLSDGRIVYINNVGYATVVDTNTNQFTVQSLDGADDDDVMTPLLERVQGYPFLGKLFVTQPDQFLM